MKVVWAQKVTHGRVFALHAWGPVLDDPQNHQKWRKLLPTQKPGAESVITLSLVPGVSAGEYLRRVEYQLFRCAPWFTPIHKKTRRFKVDTGSRKTNPLIRGFGPAERSRAENLKLNYYLGNFQPVMPNSASPALQSSCCCTRELSGW